MAVKVDGKQGDRVGQALFGGIDREVTIGGHAFFPDVAFADYRTAGGGFQS